MKDDIVADTYPRILGMKEEIHKRIIGNDGIIDNLLTALFAGGHVLLESMPGLGKTELAKTISATMNMEFKRVQGTPDLQPDDIIGELRHSPEMGAKHLMKGPLFTNFLLVDEINRAQPKTQSALLEAMAEKRVSILGTTYSLPQPFMVVATQNPVDLEGTFPLPDAQLDRFLLKCEMSYLSKEEERQVIKANMTPAETPHFFKPDEVIRIQKFIREEVTTTEELLDYILDLVEASRQDPVDVQRGASTRASVQLTLASKARAFVQGRPYVTSKDVKEIIHPVLRHRIVVTSNFRDAGYTSDHFIDKLLRKVAAPKM